MKKRKKRSKSIKKEPSLEVEKPETSQPVKIPEHPQVLEPKIKEEPIIEPVEKPVEVEKVKKVIKKKPVASNVLLDMIKNR